MTEPPHQQGAQDEKTIARIQKLLAQAEGTENEQEADAYLAKAQALATAHSIDLAMARRSGKAKDDGPTRRRFIIGEYRQRGNLITSYLLDAVAGVNDVITWYLWDFAEAELNGYAEDIDNTLAIYTSLHIQMVTACKKYLATGEHRPTPTITARLSFYRAFARRVRERLNEAAAAARKEIAGRTSGAEIALLDKKSQVQQYHDALGLKLRKPRKDSAAHDPRAARAGHNAAGKAHLTDQAAIHDGPRQIER